MGARRSYSRFSNPRSCGRRHGRAGLGFRVATRSEVRYLPSRVEVAYFGFHCVKNYITDAHNSSNAPSASFVVFFPTTSESDRQAPSETRNVSGPNNSVMYAIAQLIESPEHLLTASLIHRSWGTTFAPTRPITRPPAWHRVASEANSSTNAARIIMKRVNLPARRNCQGHFFSEKAKETAAADLLRAWTKIEKCEMSESKARRTSSYRQTDAENRVCGMPQSMAEMASAILQAKGKDGQVY